MTIRFKISVWITLLCIAGGVLYFDYFQMSKLPKGAKPESPGLTLWHNEQKILEMKAASIKIENNGKLKILQNVHDGMFYGKEKTMAVFEAKQALYQVEEGSIQFLQGLKMKMKNGEEIFLPAAEWRTEELRGESEEYFSWRYKGMYWYGKTLIFRDELRNLVATGGTTLEVSPECIVDSEIVKYDSELHHIRIIGDGKIRLYLPFGQQIQMISPLWELDVDEGNLLSAQEVQTDMPLYHVKAYRAQVEREARQLQLNGVVGKDQGENELQSQTMQVGLDNGEIRGEQMRMYFRPMYYVANNLNAEETSRNLWVSNVVLQMEKYFTERSREVSGDNVTLYRNDQVIVQAQHINMGPDASKISFFGNIKAGGLSGKMELLAARGEYSRQGSTMTLQEIQVNIENKLRGTAQRGTMDWIENCIKLEGQVTLKGENGEEYSAQELLYYPQTMQVVLRQVVKIGAGKKEPLQEQIIILLS